MGQIVVNPFGDIFKNNVLGFLDYVKLCCLAKTKREKQFIKWAFDSQFKMGLLDQKALLRLDFNLKKKKQESTPKIGSWPL